MLTSDVNRQPVSPRIALATGLLLLVVTLPIVSFDAFAQARYATLSGAITDQVGGVMVGATVTLSNVQTKAKYEVRTDRTGYYQITPLPAASYELEVRAPGFTGSRTTVTLGVGETLQRNVTLEVSNLQETISVSPSDGPARVREVARSETRKPCADPTIGGCINPPVKVKDVAPLYPTSLRDRGIRGAVMLEALVDTEGRVKDLRIVSSPHPALEQLASDAVRAWEFTPTYLNGRPIEVRFNTGVYFDVEAPKPPQRP